MDPRTGIIIPPLFHEYIIANPIPPKLAKGISGIAEKTPEKTRAPKVV